MDRRSFLAASLVPGAAAAADSGPQPLDYGRSYLSGKAAWNRVRFVVESRTRITDERSGRTEEYLQCASCKSENTFAKSDLFHSDNYDFLPVFGPEFGVIFRRKAAASDGYRQVRPSANMWDGQTMHLRVARKARRLDTTAAIRRATHAAMPLVGQTEIRNASQGLRAVIEFPVKTMNIHDEKDLYQVDTGPVVLPDLAQRPERLADTLSLAFIAFNTQDFADFIIETKTPLPTGGAVEHYSKRVRFDARNAPVALA
ncbi:MAG: hypothetical protein U0Q16_27375 [Bryobacteraceae bacterium]